MKKYRIKSAFSIIELSIVVLIISLLAGTIITANRISDNAKLNTARTLTKSSPVSDIEGLVAWFETTMIKSFDDSSADNGQAVAKWYDLSPENNNATAGSAPTYIANCINDLPALRFDGTNDYFNFNGTQIARSDHTIFIVEQRRASSSSQYILGTNSNSLTSNDAIIVGYASTGIFNVNHWALTDIPATVPNYTSPIPIISTVNFNNNSGVKIYRNGTLVTSASDANAKTILSDYKSATIGQINNSLYYKGDIAEIIIFNRYLSDNERQDVEKYLGAKWGIKVS